MPVAKNRLSEKNANNLLLSKCVKEIPTDSWIFNKLLGHHNFGVKVANRYVFEVSLGNAYLRQVSRYMSQLNQIKSNFIFGSITEAHAEPC